MSATGACPWCSAPVAAGATACPACGAALAYKRKGLPNVAMAICGDGSTSNGRSDTMLAVANPSVRPRPAPEVTSPAMASSPASAVSFLRKN